jgi:hypothetical protein
MMERVVKEEEEEDILFRTQCLHGINATTIQKILIGTFGG